MSDPVSSTDAAEAAGTVSDFIDAHAEEPVDFRVSEVIAIAELVKSKFPLVGLEPYRTESR